jgi:hypothetical protein
VTLRRDDPERRARWEWRRRHPWLNWLRRLDIQGWNILGGAVVLGVGGVVALVVLLIQNAA